MKTSFIVIGVGLLVGIGGGLAAAKFVLPQLQSTAASPSPSPLNLNTEFHQHTDLRIMIDGKQLDLTIEEYQSSTYVYKDEQIHLHDNNGGVVHLHRPGVKVGDFLATLDMELTDECLTLYEPEEKNITGKSDEKSDEKPVERQVVEAHCKQAGDNKSLVVMVNGFQQLEGANYKLQDLDKVLIYFGPADQKVINEQMALVTDDACLYSETCPERGKPPVENCTASADTPCVVVE